MTEGAGGNDLICTPTENYLAIAADNLLCYRLNLRVLHLELDYIM